VNQLGVEVEVTSTKSWGAASARPAEVASPETNGAHPAPATLAAAAKRRRDSIRRRDSLFRRSLGVADAWAVGAALVIGGAVLGENHLTFATLAVPPLFVVVCKALGLYDRDEHLLHKTTLDEVPALFGIATLSALLLYLADGLLIDGHLDRGQILTTWVLVFVLMICFRALARMLAGGVTTPERCVLVGDPGRAEELRRRLSLTPSVRAELVGIVPTGTPNGGATDAELHPDLGPMLASQEIDRVVLSPGLHGGDELLFIIRELKSHGVKVSVLPEASRVAGSSVETDHLHGMTLLGVRRFEITSSSRLIKRSFDLLGSSLCLVLLAPLMAVIAIAIRLDSPGPVLFRQLRAGRRGEPFEMLKFRSMVDGADERKEELRHLNEADGVFKITDDPRVTRVGRALRRAHLDELPQLLNVLRGEMSLVGPRPLPLDEDRAIVGWHRERLEVRPGITGYWQVLGSSRIPVKEMVKLDYLYMANWSLWGDVKLVLRTVPVVLRRRGL
jgi:exopolysaccharide biosynthesis polyprenyl glycosylphosphotransferase